MEEMTGKTISSIHLIGGGCQSKYLSSRTANICGRIVHSGPVEAATTGNILVQAIALNHINNLDEARSMVRDSFDVRIYQPDNGEKRDTHETHTRYTTNSESRNQDYSRFLELRKMILSKS